MYDVLNWNIPISKRPPGDPLGTPSRPLGVHGHHFKSPWFSNRPFERKRLPLNARTRYIKLI